MLLHVLRVGPDTCFNESNLRVLPQFMLDLEPDITLVIDLIHKLHQGAQLKQLIAHLILHLGQKMEEIIAIYLGIR